MSDEATQREELDAATYEPELDTYGPRPWRDLLLEDFKDTRNVPAKGDSYERMLARVDAWAACLDQLESQNQALQERIEELEAQNEILTKHIADLDYDFIQAMTDAENLSPPQETDPE